MNVKIQTKVVIRLDAAETFTAADNYAEKRVEIEASHITIMGESAWCKGLAYKADGTLGKAEREVLIDLTDVPIHILVGVIGELV